MLVTILTAAVCGLFGTSMAQQTCVQGQNCVLPDCFCPTFKHPNFADVKQIPQMVYFGFDDALNIAVDKYYSQLFAKTRVNPNGCPISMSLYVQNDYTNYALVNKYYTNGNEIGSHSVTHTMIDTAEKLRREAGEQKNNLASEGRIPLDQVVGWRSPNLQTAGDVQPTVLKELGYTYDISLTYTRRSMSAESPWPYTLDFGYPYFCSVPPCPGKTSSHKGFWEIPVNSMFSKETGFPCVYVDACRPNTEAEALEFLWDNFQTTYNGNRAAFGLNMHAAWFFTPDYLMASHAFIERLLTLDDVYIVSAKQVLDWMRTPKSVAELKDLPTWGCPNPSSTQRPTTLYVSNSPVLINYTVQTVGRPRTLFTFPTLSPRTTTTTTTATTPSSYWPSSFIPVSQTGWQPTINNVRHDECVQGINCNLPYCQCRGTYPPGGLPVLNTPQIIYITVTSRLNGANFQNILSLLESRNNPNNCPITSTLFVPGSGNYVPYVQSLRSRGHEIAMYGSDAHVYSQQRPLAEQIALELAIFRGQESDTGLRPGAGGVDLGYRSPAADTLGEGLLAALNASAVQYDSSFRSSRRVNSQQPPVWPYTLDYGWQGCGQDWPLQSACPTGRYQGLWEIPIVPLVDYKAEFMCSYADACHNHPPTSQDTFNYFMANFQRALDSHRAPFGIHLRQEWFSHPFYSPNLKGLEMFLDTVLKTRSDVYVVSAEKLLDWIKEPVGLDKIKSFAPWGC